MLSAAETRLEDLPTDRNARVVGWLVCVVGPSKGKDYRIVPEKNYVGSAEDMEIRVDGDKEINERNHAVIVYDPERNETLVFSGTSNGIVHWLSWAAEKNEAMEMVRDYQRLEAGDRLKIGESEFLYVPFCNYDNKGFSFDWKE